MNKIKQAVKTFCMDEQGIGTLEIIMIVAVIVIIAVAFRKWIMKWVSELFNSTSQNIDDFNIDNPTNLNPASNNAA